MCQRLLSLDVSPLARSVALLITCVSAYGCANITSINRTSTLLPSNATSASPEHGRAIHLDIKQRVVLAKPMAYRDQDGKLIESLVACAEPSPDALSAFASAVGAGTSDPTKRATSVSGALTEAASSIGLRTQSITLMRDSLYRICEAYYNGQLTKPQVMLLMARSQDLTTTVLAVEQLTGAVVASQAALGGTAAGSGNATLVGSAKALENVRTLEQKAREDLDAATKVKEAVKVKRDEKDKEVKTKEKQLQAAPDGNKPTLQVELDGLKADLASLQKETDQAVSDEAFKQKTLETYTTSRIALQQQLDAAVTSATTGTGSTATLVANPAQVAANAQIIEKVAQSVEKIATAALSKKYVNETCVAVVTQERERKDSIEIKGLDQVSKAQEAYLVALAKRDAARSDLTSAEDAIANAKDEYDAALQAKRGLEDSIGANLSQVDVSTFEIDSLMHQLALLRVRIEEERANAPSPITDLLNQQANAIEDKLTATRRSDVENRASLKYFERKLAATGTEIDMARSRMDASRVEHRHAKGVLESADKGLAEAISKQSEAVTQSQQRNLYGTCLEVLLTTAKGEKEMLEAQMTVGKAQAVPEQTAAPGSAK